MGTDEGGEDAIKNRSYYDITKFVRWMLEIINIKTKKI